MSFLSTFKHLFAKSNHKPSGKSLCDLSDGAEDFEYFKDVTFSITDTKRVGKDYVYDCYGLHDGETVGFKICISNSIGA